MSHKRVLIIVPARYTSTRFPGKPLALLDGKPIIQHVYERAIRSKYRVVIATDDERIALVAHQFGAEVAMTQSSHRSGTDRVIEAYQIAGQGEEIVVNLQGDEPFVNPMDIDTLISAFNDTAAQIATLAEVLTPDTSDDYLRNPNIVKLTRGYKDLFALYFSRSVIPYPRDVAEGWARCFQYYRHIGLYAFRSDILVEIQKLSPSELELAESLEQLRWLGAGYRIKVLNATASTIGIDTPEDLKIAEKYLRSL